MSIWASIDVGADPVRACPDYGYNDDDAPPDTVEIDVAHARAWNERVRLWVYDVGARTDVMVYLTRAEAVLLAERLTVAARSDMPTP